MQYVLHFMTSYLPVKTISPYPFFCSRQQKIPPLSLTLSLTLSLSLSHSLYLTLSLSLSFSLSLKHTHTHTPSLSLFLTFCLFVSLFLSLSFCLSFSHSVTKCECLTLSLSVCLSLFISVYPSLVLALSYDHLCCVSIVYFYQQMGASHTVCNSNSSFSALSYLFLLFMSQQDRFTTCFKTCGTGSFFPRSRLVFGCLPALRSNT